MAWNGYENTKCVHLKIYIMENSYTISVTIIFTTRRQGYCYRALASVQSTAFDHFVLDF